MKKGFYKTTKPITIPGKIVIPQYLQRFIEGKLIIVDQLNDLQTTDSLFYNVLGIPYEEDVLRTTYFTYSCHNTILEYDTLEHAVNSLVNDVITGSDILVLSIADVMMDTNITIPIDTDIKLIIDEVNGFWSCQVIGMSGYYLLREGDLNTLSKKLIVTYKKANKIDERGVIQRSDGEVLKVGLEDFNKFRDYIDNKLTLKNVENFNGLPSDYLCERLGINSYAINNLLVDGNMVVRLLADFRGTEYNNKLLDIRNYKSKKVDRFLKGKFALDVSDLSDDVLESFLKALGLDTDTYGSRYLAILNKELIWADTYNGNVRELNHLLKINFTSTYN